MKYLSLFLLATGISVSSEAKIWRVNNTPGVTADFTTLNGAMSNGNVNAGDTLYFEPSAISYSGGSITRTITIIGPGYWLDAANSGNGGLQATVQEADFSGTIFVRAAASNTKIMGITSNSIQLEAASDVVIERVKLTSSFYFNQDATRTTIRKCFLNGGIFIGENGGTGIDVTIENNIFSSAYISLPNLKGTNNIVRNNSFQGNNALTLVNTYFANNIIGASVQSTLTNCTIKNNLFRAAQNLPTTATGNKINQNMDDVYENTGSADAKFKLKAGSPAIGAGLSANGVNNPDCGAFGATDPYVLSGIPNIPTIYSFTAPTSIPSGSATMNITFSTRNNN